MSHSKSRSGTKRTREPHVLFAGALWGASSLLIAIAVVLVVVGLALKPASWPFTVAFYPPALAAAALLTLLITTLPREEAYEWNADFTAFPGVIRWPLAVGAWIGHGVVIAVDLVSVFSTSSSTTLLSASSRASVSVLAVLGAIASVFTLQATPVKIVLFVAWGLIVLISVVRGIYGFIRETTSR
ncbi:hypothetical protein [Timonella senegalensis]|uniref:hypothetical protein n=1 Tax=Timonella senegalensis TaxID=1465825 RepID=UPI002FDE59B6